MRFSRDYYRIIGVPPTASPDEIKRAFRGLARRYHPDVNKAPDAEARFKELNEAYQVLGDPVKRAAYDRFHRPGVCTTPYPRPHSTYTPPGYPDTQTRPSASPPRRSTRGLGNLAPGYGVLWGLASVILGVAILVTVALVPPESSIGPLFFGLLFLYSGIQQILWQNNRTRRAAPPGNAVMGRLTERFCMAGFSQVSA